MARRPNSVSGRPGSRCQLERVVHLIQWHGCLSSLQLGHSIAVCVEIHSEIRCFHRARHFFRRLQFSRGRAAGTAIHTGTRRVPWSLIRCFLEFTIFRCVCRRPDRRQVSGRRPAVSGIHCMRVVGPHLADHPSVFGVRTGAAGKGLKRPEIGLVFGESGPTIGSPSRI